MANMDSRYIRLNVIPIIVEILFVIAYLIFKDFIIYIYLLLYDVGNVFLLEKRF